jgi:hypothetical protein
MQYKTWLLLREKANEPLQKLTQRFGCFTRCDHGERPFASLRIAEDPETGVRTPQLWVADEEKFLEYLWRPEHKVGRQARLTAFSAAPLSVLQELDGAWLRGSKMQLYSIHCGAAEGVTARTEPYFRRFVEIREETKEPGDWRGRVRDAKAVGDFECDLYFDPIVLDLTEGRIKFLLSSDGEVIREANAYFLPPVRIAEDYDEWSETLNGPDYLSPGLIQLRQSLLSALGFDKPQDEEPSIISMVRLLDDPIIRDILWDGGAPDVDVENTKPTRWTVRFCQEGDLASYRTKVFIRPAAIEVADWSGADCARVGTCLQEDLRALAPFSMLPEAGSEAMDWGIAEAGKTDAASVHHEGSYPLIAGLGKRLEQNDERTAFQGLVTWGAAPVDDQPPSHDLAERNFIRRLFRCPWLRPPGPPWMAEEENWGKAWTDAVRDLLVYEFNDSPICLEDRVVGWTYLNCRLENTGGGAVIYHSYRSQQYEVLTCRLLAPLGTVLRADRTICLDDPVRSLLDEGFVLG